MVGNRWERTEKAPRREDASIPFALKSKASAHRVAHSVTDWVENKLGLEVNAAKTNVSRLMKVKYLGFGFFKDNKTKNGRAVRTRPPF